MVVREFSVQRVSQQTSSRSSARPDNKKTTTADPSPKVRRSASTFDLRGHVLARILSAACPVMVSTIAPVPSFRKKKSEKVYRYRWRQSPGRRRELCLDGVSEVPIITRKTGSSGAVQAVNAAARQRTRQAVMAGDLAERGGRDATIGIVARRAERLGS